MGALVVFDLFILPPVFGEQAHKYWNGMEWRGEREEGRGKASLVFDIPMRLLSASMKAAAAAAVAFLSLIKKKKWEKKSN